MAEKNALWPSEIRIRSSFQIVPLGEGVGVPESTQLEVTGKNGHPDATITFIATEGGDVQVREVRVMAKERGRPVQTSDLTSLSLDTLAERVMAAYGVGTRFKSIPDSPGAHRGHWGVGASTDEGWAIRRQVVHKRGSRRRNQVDASQLQRVAEIYGAASSAPVRAVAAHFGISERTAARRIALARDQNLIPRRGST